MKLLTYLLKKHIKRSRRELALLEKHKEAVAFGREQFRELIQKNLTVPVALR